MANHQQPESYATVVAIQFNHSLNGTHPRVPCSTLNMLLAPFLLQVDNSSVDLEGFDIDQSVHSSSSQQPFSSSEDEVASSWGPGDRTGDRLEIPKSELPSPVSDLICSVTPTWDQTWADAGLFVNARSAGAAPQVPLNEQSSSASVQGRSQNALLQQGMAEASARLLAMGSQWGSNLGSLCNLGLILSPEGFILLSPKYEILEIIGEGAYGKAIPYKHMTCHTTF